MLLLGLISGPNNSRLRTESLTSPTQVGKVDLAIFRVFGAVRRAARCVRWARCGACPRQIELSLSLCELRTEEASLFLGLGHHGLHGLHLRLQALDKLHEG